MAKDIDHYIVRTALEKEGWTITHDPYVLKFSGKRRREIDLGAEKFIAAEKGTETIVVEVKGFRESSFIYEFNKAFGQYSIYRFFLKKRDPLRRPFLAVPQSIYEKEFHAPDIEELCQEFGIEIIVYNIDSQTIVQWIGK
jgi:XisH protein